ncbi:putative soyasaponin III rhamnosyltransferase [Helianthus debilis subsp. tardiflorus]
MFPWLAFGHILPFLEPSKFIAQNGYKASFLSTTRNIQRLPTLPSHLPPLINLVKLAIPYVKSFPKIPSPPWTFILVTLMITSREVLTVFSRKSLGFLRKSRQTGLFMTLLPTVCFPLQLALGFHVSISSLSPHGS